MPSLDWNASYWNDEYGWDAGGNGEEWSAAWGGSRCQWHATILPRIAHWLPASHVVEIACGRGRWTQFLLEQSVRFVGFDLSPRCVEYCERTFSGPNASYFATDGKSLDAVGDREVDFVFSFDSLVHAEMDVIESYLAEIGRILRPGGSAFLHHSNVAALEKLPADQLCFRAESVSAAKIRQLASRFGLVATIQETVSWWTPHLIDAFTTLRKGTKADYGEPQFIENAQFWPSLEHVRKTVGAYWK